MTETITYSAELLALKRQDLAEAKIALREAADYEKRTRAYWEQAAIDEAERTAPAGTKAGTALGANKEDRERALLLIICNNEAVGAAVNLLDDAQAAVDRLTAEVEGLVDLAREARRVSSDKYSDALIGYYEAWGTMRLTDEERAQVPF